MPHPRPGPCHATRVYTLIAGSTLTATHCQCLPDLWSNATLPPPNSLLPLKPQYSPTQTPTILHQPPETWFSVIFSQNPQILNGISVSDTPIFGERPYPRQFHPVEMTPIFALESSISRPPQQIYTPHDLCQVPPSQTNSPQRRLPIIPSSNHTCISK